MSNLRFRHSRQRATTVALLFAALITTGCARAKIENARRYTQDDVVPRPPVVIVYAFAADADDVLLDTLGMRDATDDELSSEARRIQNRVAIRIVAQLNERGINAERGSETTNVPLNAFLLKGQFLTLDEGSRVQRMVVGFGAGAEQIQTQVQVYRAASGGAVRVASAEVTSEGNRMPGVAAPIGVGAAAGQLWRSAVISGGMNVAQEVTGGLDRAADNLAGKIADRAEAFYKEKGWL